jgi:COMPASS component SPP1
MITPAQAKTARSPTTPTVKKATASRSRSTSTMPGGSADPEGDPKAEKQEEEESDGHEDDKLYCVCKTKYDEDRFMIACDRRVLPHCLCEDKS